MQVIITGIGVLNALGLGRASYWRELLKANSGISQITGFDTASYRANVGAEIREFNPKVFMPPVFYRRLSRLSRLAVVASIEAIQDSGLDLEKENRQRIGTVFGTALGSTHQTDCFFLSSLDHGPGAAEPILFPDTVPNAPASHVAIYHQLQGPNSTICQNHLSGECALAFALSLLETEQADGLVVGGVDELSDILFRGLDALRALKPRSETKRFDPCHLVSGKGFILGEGATCLVVEKRDAIKKKERLPYGRVQSLTLSSAVVEQAHYEPDGSAMAQAMEAALYEARLKPEEIDIIILAANGIEELENAEATALELAFGSRWHQIPRIPLRYFVGDFGSAGLLATATVVMALREGVIPPHVQAWELTGAPGDPQRFAPARKANLRAGMVVGSTYGGGSSCLIVART